MKSTLSILSAFLILLAVGGSAFADVKVKSKQTMAGQTFENTTYIKGHRQRSESMNGAMVNITQCDLRRAIQMNPAAKTFIVNEFGQIETTNTAGTPSATGAAQPVTTGGRVVTTITVNDTGERKQMFGFTARHLIITMSTESSPDACNKNNTKMQTDGWYIDFDVNFDCEQESLVARGRNGGKTGGCQDKYEMKTVGTAKRGYPVYEKMTMFDEAGKETMSWVSEVVELSKSTLDPALFEVPSDYREVSDASQMYASSSTTTMGSSAGQMTSMDAGGAEPSGVARQVQSAAAASPGPAGAPAGPKAPGTIRLGLAYVKTDAVGEGISAQDLAAVVQNTLREYLKVPGVEVVIIEGRLPAAISTEAAEKECDFVIHSTVSHKKGKKGGFGFGSVLGSAVSAVAPMAGIAGHVAGSAIMTATSMAGQVKSKDELSIVLRLITKGNTEALNKNFTVKAKSDGDDIISAIVEQTAQSIVTAIGK
jgi:hypothetical protein